MSARVAVEKVSEITVIDGKDHAAVIEWSNGEGFSFETASPNMGSATHGGMTWLEWELLIKAVARAKVIP